MSSVAEIKEAIAKLSPREFCELMAELVPRSDDEWDRQMRVDAESGKLDFIDRNVGDSVAKGTTMPLDAGFERECRLLRLVRVFYLELFLIRSAATRIFSGSDAP